MRRGPALVTAAVMVVTIAVVVVFLGACLSGTSAGGNSTPTATVTRGPNTPCMPSDVMVIVKNKQGEVVVGAEVSVIGPYPVIPGVTPEYNGRTDDQGVAKIRVSQKGDYDVSVRADGYEKAVLVGMDSQTVGRAPKVDCGETKVEVGLDRPGEVPRPSAPTATATSTSPTATPAVGTPTATPALGSFAFVYTQGVDDKAGVCRSLFAHRVIGSCDEINEPVPVTKSGTGWSTYVRSGQTIQTVGGVSYSDEPFFEVTFRVPRADGLEVVYVQRKCGNVSAPPGKMMPPEKPFAPMPPRLEVPPTSTSTSVSQPPPSATDTPRSPVATPVPPTVIPPTQRPNPTQTAQPTPKPGCNCTPTDPDRPKVLPTPVNTIVYQPTPMPVQTIQPDPVGNNTPVGH